MTKPQPTLSGPAARQQAVVLSVLLVVATLAWTVVMKQAVGDRMDMGPADGHSDAMHMASGDSRVDAPNLSMGGAALPYLGSWIAMMAAMMLPAAAPMILFYARAQPGRPLNISVFTGAYLLLWATFGVVAFAMAVSLERLIDNWPFAARNWGRAAGVLILAAGLYQLSALKEACLKQCRSPLAFILQSWREGTLGAARMGVHHGLYCAGCCWLLFLVLVPIGVMDILAMVLVALVVFSEKVLPRPNLTRRLVAVLLVGYGIAVTLRPALLPTVA